MDRPHCLSDAAGVEEDAARGTKSSTDRSKAAERAEALGTQGMDAATRQVKMAKQKLQQAHQKTSELKARLRELKKDNATAYQKLNRSITKAKKFTDKYISAKLKEEERAQMKGKHVHLDVKKYMDRITQGNMDSYGLWTWDDTKPHFWEKTWDTLSNHIFGLDKLAKTIWNKTEYDQQVKKYMKYQKFFSAKIAAASMEAKEVSAELAEAARETEEAMAVIQDASEAKEASAEQRKRAREELARLKAERKRDEAKEQEAEALDAQEGAAPAQDEEEAEDP